MSLCPTVCEVARVFTNKGKPPTHKPISAAALEETSVNKGKAPRGPLSRVPALLEREVPSPSTAAMPALVF